MEGSVAFGSLPKATWSQEGGPSKRPGRLPSKGDRHAALAAWESSQLQPVRLQPVRGFRLLQDLADRHGSNPIDRIRTDLDETRSLRTFDRSI